MGFWWTIKGNETFNRSLRLKAHHLGYTLNQRGLFKTDFQDFNRHRSTKSIKGTRIASRTEAEIFKILQVDHLYVVYRGLFETLMSISIPDTHCICFFVLFFFTSRGQFIYLLSAIALLQMGPDDDVDDDGPSTILPYTRPPEQRNV